MIETGKIKIGMGRDSRRFLPEDFSKPCVIAGLIFEDAPGFAADSDGDVIFSAICNAITSITGVPILQGVARDLYVKNGITDSQCYLEKALESFGSRRIDHVALSLEGKRPKLEGFILSIREHIAKVLNLQVDQVGCTVNTGEGLTDFGCGEGVQCFCVLTVTEL